MTRQQARGLVLAATLVAGLPAIAQGIPRGAAGRIAGLLGEAGGDRVLPGGYVYSDVSIDRDRVTFTLTRKAGGQVVGRVRLLPRPLAAPGDRKSLHFAIRVEALDPGPQVAAALDAAVANVVRLDVQGLWVQRAVGSHSVGGRHSPSAASPSPSAPLSPAARRAIWLAQMALAVALLVGLWIFAVRRPRRGAGAGPPSSP